MGFVTPEPPKPPTPNRWIAAVDLGKLKHFSAIVLFEERRDLNVWAVRHLERIERGTPYHGVVQRVAAHTTRAPLADNCQVVVDAGGVGEAVMEIFYRVRLRASLVPLVSSGPGMAHRNEYGRWVVPKTEIIDAAEVMLQADPPRVVVPPSIPMYEAWVEEMKQVRGTLTERGVKYTHETEDGGHGDMATAFCMGCWVADRMPVPKVSFGYL